MHNLYVCIAEFEDSYVRFGQYRYMIWPILSYVFAKTSIRFRQYPVYHFVNTSEGTFQRLGQVFGPNRRF